MQCEASCSCDLTDVQLIWDSSHVFGHSTPLVLNDHFPVMSQTC